MFEKRFYLLMFHVKMKHKIFKIHYGLTMRGQVVLIREMDLKITIKENVYLLPTLLYTLIIDVL